MKLASLKGGRDGRLVVVSNDLAWFTEAHHIAPTLQAALDHWEGMEPALRALAESLELGAVPRERFHEHQAASPLPRAYQWADGSAYVKTTWPWSARRLPKRGDAGGSFWTDPLMARAPGRVRRILGTPRSRYPWPTKPGDWILEGEVAVITGDVAQGATREQALAAHPAWSCSAMTFRCAT